MPKTVPLLTSRKVKALATKASTAPSMLTTEETRELGDAVLSHLALPSQPAVETAATASKKASPATVKKAAKKTSAKKTTAKSAPAPVKTAKKSAGKKAAQEEVATTIEAGSE